ncbi:MAG: GFA family protein [Paracoccus sp. (in: a-proteobacteria)]|nr:GFA family protein [Paracoccus sp. (in: a-proteobacteria)]
MTEVTGACLCGAIRFRGQPQGEVTRCHCEQCRRWAGDAWSSVSLEGAEITGDTLRWFRSSEGAERGFCATCGASVFWREVSADTVAASMGCLDAPTGLRLNRHIYTAFKGDYYEISDGLAQDAVE